jgi:hypothetical protein
MRWRSIFLALLTLITYSSSVGAEQWVGERLRAQPTSRGLKCSVTRMTLETRGDRVIGRLIYNGTVLKGSITGTKIKFSGLKRRLSYSFEGTVAERSMRGTWLESMTGCHGTWRVSPK